MEEQRIRDIFNAILEKAKENGEQRDYITDEELATYFPIMGCNAKRIRYHVNHSNLQASGRVKRACVFCIREVIAAVEWKKGRTKVGF